MNRFLVFGIAAFFAIVGVSLLGGQREASASLLNLGLRSGGCDGAKAKCCGRAKLGALKGKLKRCSGRKGLNLKRCSGRKGLNLKRCSGRKGLNLKGKLRRCSGHKGHGHGHKHAPAKPKSDAPPAPPASDAKKA